VARTPYKVFYFSRDLGALFRTAKCTLFQVISFVDLNQCVPEYGKSGYLIIIFTYKSEGRSAGQSILTVLSTDWILGLFGF
jgi:hypothetical protein